MSEGSNNPGEGQNNQVNLEELSAKMSKLEADLDAERKSKERILEESKRYKEGYQAYKSKEDQTKQALAAQEEERLKKEGQFSTLLEQRDSRIKELEDSLTNTRSEVENRDKAIVNFRKAAAFEKALGGKMKNDAYWSHVDFDSIAINPENGSIDSHSLQKAADGFMESHKELVDFGSTANLPNGTPAGSAKGKITYEQWKKLPLAEQKKRMKDVID